MTEHELHTTTSDDLHVRKQSLRFRIRFRVRVRLRHRRRFGRLTSDRDVRKACRDALFAYLRSIRRAETDLRIVAGIYHGFYAMGLSGDGARGVVRWNQLWNFLRRMEDEHQVTCAYDRDGRVVSVEARVK